MKFFRIGQQPWLAWVTVGLLATACGVLALLQYRWITEFSAAERDRLHAELQGRLNLLSRSFAEEISSANMALAIRLGDDPDSAELAARYDNWRQSHGPLFNRVALIVASDGGARLSNFDPSTGRFSPAEWPPDWEIVRRRFEARLNHTPVPALEEKDFALIEIVRLGRRGPSEASIVGELNLNYLRENLLPRLLQKFLTNDGKLEYDAEAMVGVRDAPPVLIYRSGPEFPATEADASVMLSSAQNLSPLNEPREPRRGGGPKGPPPDRRRDPGPPQMRGPRGLEQDPPDAGAARWRLSVRHHAGSLESLVNQARSRNLAISLGLLGLILAAVGSLMRLSRQSERLAELQMNFVAGVSHELRTPLTVIRTAAFNLRGKLAHRPDQVEKYGKLIQEESEKLGALVEQVLCFASGQAGHVIREREEVAVGTLIEDSLRSSLESAEAQGVEVEMRVDPELPPVLADKLAMQHALRNLLENALKYGTPQKDGSQRPWVGIFASFAKTGSRSADIEIRVADRGPGIPAEEQAHIFDPFFRGRRAVADQVHGTGLGLSLVKKIIEAHGGQIEVLSGPSRGTEFIVRIPVAHPEVEYELAHSLS